MSAVIIRPPPNLRMSWISGELKQNNLENMEDSVPTGPMWSKRCLAAHLRVFFREFRLLVFWLLYQSGRLRSGGVLVRLRGGGSCWWAGTSLNFLSSLSRGRLYCLQMRVRCTSRDVVALPFVGGLKWVYDRTHFIFKHQGLVVAKTEMRSRSWGITWSDRFTACELFWQREKDLHVNQSFSWIHFPS